MRQDLILKRPIITEKTLILAQDSRFTFEVDLKASKHQIAELVAKQFKVDVVKVSTITTNGKEKRFGSKRKPTKLSDTKKAIVTLKKGQKIDYFDVVEDKK